MTQNILNLKKSILLLILLFVSLGTFSQTKIFEKEIKLKALFKDKRESFPIVNNQTNEVILLLFDNKNINSLQFNKKFELISEFALERPKNKYNVILGHSVDSKGYHVYLTNEKKSQFYVTSLDIENKSGASKEIEIQLKNEKFLETVSYNDKFYLLTVLKKTSILKAYVFEGNKITHTQEFDFSDNQFSDYKDDKLYDILKDNNSISIQADLEIQKIDNSNPNPLDLTTKENKIFYYNNHIYLTIDNCIENTKIISINLDNYHSMLSIHNQVETICDGSNRIKSNSYLFGNNLYQIKGCKKELSIQIKNLGNSDKIKEYSVNADEEINFRNSDLMQEGSTYLASDSERKLGKTKQILRKISASDIGISVDSINDMLELTIGGYKEVKRSRGGGMMMTTP